ncbi:MAG: ABC transporter permease [Otoolea sp.]|nr:ABC transporter permease [Clostridiaceae bacterium]MDD6073240.1 ABC transporter permease [Clostridium sp.]MDY5482625.1 ABC transporter permease [Clostridium sp.]
MENTSFSKKVLTWIGDNLVTLIFLAFTIVGFSVSNVSFSWFLGELTGRLYRNGFLVLSLIIPVVAGLGLNFGIVVGAMAGQIAVVFVRYFEWGNLGGFFTAILLSVPLAVLFGWLTGLLYNKTRGQEMIASLIVGYFANGLYQFLFLFVVGVIIKVPSNHPLIKPDGIGIRSTVDLGIADKGGLKYALDNLAKIPFTHAMILIAAAILIFQVVRFFRAKQEMKLVKNRVMTGINVVLCLIVIGIAVNAIVSKNSLTTVAKVPVVTLLIIIGLCIFTELLLKTKLGQDFKAVGQSQRIAEVSGIDVDKTRIIAVILSTVLAAWGQIIFLQNVGTLNTYNAHSQVGMFAVASILVGGASTSKATVGQAIIGTILFNAMFIMSPEIGQAVFGQALLGEYFRTFMVYGVIGFALGIYVWKANRKNKLTI